MEIDAGADRRRHKRYRVREGTLAFLGPIPGTIKDISRGGMSIKYVVFEKRPAQILKLDIFFPEENFFLPDIPACIISDIDCPAKAPFSAVRVRRLGIKFGELSREQEVSLQYYLQYHAIVEV